MYFMIRDIEKVLKLRISRRGLLSLGLSVPFLNSFSVPNTNLNTKIKSIIGTNGVISLAKIDTGRIIACSNFNKAILPTTIGSVAKIFTALALLNSRLISESSYYNCKGSDIINGKVLKCWNESGHGNVNLEKAISKSCNLFFHKNVQELSINEILKIYKEVQLNIIEPMEVNKQNNHTYIQWLGQSYSKNLVDSIALGLLPQMKLSQFQILSAVSCLARENIYIPLHLDDRILTGKKIYIDKQNLSIVKLGMIKSAKEGTSKLLGNYGFEAAAKTGTATNFNINDGKNHGWCVGYVPYNRPKIAFSVMIENGTGYSDAVPVALKTLKLCKDFGYL